MARKKAGKRRFGAVRQYESGRWTASYVDPTGLRRRAPQTFSTKTDADIWLSQIEADLTRGDWTDPDAGAVNFEEYALRWVEERELSATTDELYRRLLRLHILPTFERLDLDEITPPRVRAWRAERLETTSAGTTVAKAYRLLKAILETAADDELIRRNPCRIKGAGKESAEERPVATVEQVDALAEYGNAVEADGLLRRIRQPAPRGAGGALAAGRDLAGRRRIVEAPTGRRA